MPSVRAVPPSRLPRCEGMKIHLRCCTSRLAQPASSAATSSSKAASASAGRSKVCIGGSWSGLFSDAVVGEWLRLAAAPEQARRVPSADLAPGRPAVVALVGAFGAFHVAQQRVHFFDASAGGWRAPRRGRPWSTGARRCARWITLLASYCASSASTLRASSTTSPPASAAGCERTASVPGRQRRHVQAEPQQVVGLRFRPWRSPAAVAAKVAGISSGCDSIAACAQAAP